MSGLDHRLEPPTEVRRFEVISGALGRRRWSDDERSRILEETLTPGAVVSTVARRNGLTPQQLFTWRRSARKKAEALVGPAFVPAVVVPALEPAVDDPGVRRKPVGAARTAMHAARPPRAAKGTSHAAASIELDIGGVTVRIGDGASPATIAAVIGALKGAP